jgi:TonB-linked SusC/RagA family outer membrane protein
MKNRIISTLFLLLVSAMAFAQKINVGGTVKDENGEIIPGAAIVDKQNPKNGVVTDIDGKYSISVSRDGFLEISSLGFATLLEPVKGRTTIDIILKTESSDLDEIVVIAYGTAKKSDLTGAVSTVDMKSISDVPATSIESALQGRVAGADFVSTTGEPGTSGSVQIRGSRSISASNEPLIVVDGVVDAVTDISELNPSDIKSISILKDVSSTSLYGSRGANGVILITTNTPTSSNFTVKLKMSAGVSEIAGKLDLMNASEFAEYCNMTKYFASSLQGQPQTKENYFFEDPSVFGEGTDWIKTMSRLGSYQDYNLFLAGGSRVTRADVNFSYNDTKGVVIGSGFQRWTGRIFVESHPFKWLRLGGRVYYANRVQDFTTAAITGTDSNAAIYLTPLLGKEDTWNSWGSEVSSGGSVFNNPFIVAENVTNQKQMKHLNVMPYMRLFLGRAQFLTKFSYIQQNDRRWYYSPTTLPVTQRYQRGGTAANETYDSRTIISENTLTYDRVFNRVHTLNLLAGFTAENKIINLNYYNGTGYLDDNVTSKNMAALLDERNLMIHSYETIRTRLSVLGRINYDYKKRYYLTLTARADGASNFSDSNKWGFFPAVAFRWNIKNEMFLRGAKWIDELALRASAGRSGNDAISTYLSLPTLTSVRSEWLFGNYQPISYYTTRLANSNLTWETTDSYNIGINFEAFRHRLIVELDAYRSRTIDLLLAMKTNQNTGYDTYFNNIGSTLNTGIETTLTTRNINKKNFSWSTTFTISHNTQVVENVGEEGLIGTFYNPRNTTQPLYGYKNGYPVNALWGYQYAGVWKNQEEIDRNKISHTYAGNTNPALGDCKYVDVNNDGVLDQNDMIFQGSSDPVIYGGLQNSFTIGKNLSLKAFVSYSLGGKIYNIWQFWNGSGSRAYNKYRFMLDSWHPTRNPDSNIPRAGYEDLVGSDRMIYDASYIRLKELSINYRINMPAKIKWVKSIVIGFSAENVALWKNYIGFDPDVSTSAAARRIDNASYPRPRTYVFNVNFNY